MILASESMLACTLEAIFGPSANGGPGAGASMRDPIMVEQGIDHTKVELLSEIMGVLIVRSGFDNAKPVSLPSSIFQLQQKI